MIGLLSLVLGQSLAHPATRPHYGCDERGMDLLLESPSVQMLAPYEPRA